MAIYSEKSDIFISSHCLEDTHNDIIDTKRNKQGLYPFQILPLYYVCGCTFYYSGRSFFLNTTEPIIRAAAAIAAGYTIFIIQSFSENSTD